MWLDAPPTAFMANWLDACSDVAYAWGVRDDRNIVLIGMPGVGKSTVGVLLAKTLSREYVDTDVMIQARERRRLQEIIDTEGLATFLRVEAQHILELSCRRSVIATGGSVVYNKPAMLHLGRSGILVHLDLPLAQLRPRLTDLATRGVAMAAGQSLASLYRERDPLYRRYADVTVHCGGLTHDEVVQRIVTALDGAPGTIAEIRADRAG